MRGVFHGICIEPFEEKRHITVPKIELSEDKKEELDLLMQSVQPGTMLTIIYYHENEYVKKTGMVAKIDPQMGWIQIVKEKIRFEDIQNIIVE